MAAISRIQTSTISPTTLLQAAIRPRTAATTARPAATTSRTVSLPAAFVARAVCCAAFLAISRRAFFCAAALARWAGEACFCSVRFVAGFLLQGGPLPGKCAGRFRPAGCVGSAGSVRRRTARFFESLCGVPWTGFTRYGNVCAGSGRTIPCIPLHVRKILLHIGLQALGWFLHGESLLRRLALPCFFGVSNRFLPALSRCLLALHWIFFPALYPLVGRPGIWRWKPGG